MPVDADDPFALAPFSQRGNKACAQAGVDKAKDLLK
jgi:hypothetical protein